MKNSRSLKIAIQLAVFYFSLTGFCQSVHAQSEIRFRLVHDTIVVVSLMANDQGPFDFVLDTGTDTSIVDQSLASKLSLVSLDGIQLTTLAGNQTLTRSSLRILAAGSARAESLRVLIQDLAELRKVDSHIQGVLGQNFLLRFNYLLDYRKRSLRFEIAHEIRDAIEGDHAPMEVSENKIMVISEAQSIGRAKLLLKLDSGANAVVLIRKALRALRLPIQDDGLEATSSGLVGFLVGRLHALTVGSQSSTTLRWLCLRPDPMTRTASKTVSCQRRYSKISTSIIESSL